MRRDAQEPLPVANTEERDLPFQLILLMLISGAAIAIVSPFVVFRLVNGEIQEAVMNAAVVGGVAVLASLAWYSKRIAAAAGALTVFYTAMVILLVYQREEILLFWLYAVAVANLFILARHHGMLLNGLALVAVLPLHSRFGVFNIAIFIGSYLLVNSLAYIVSRVTENRRRTIESAEALLREKSYFLGERVKELNCINRVSEIVQATDRPFDELLQEVVETIPPGWQYPEITAARIRMDGHEYCSEEFSDTPWKLTQVISVNDEPAGSIEVFYLEARLAADDGPFLREERALLELIAHRLGQFVERNRAQTELRRLLNEDSLTGLLSRTGFVECLGSAGRHRAESESVDWLLVLNLRGVNDINQVYGYAFGDQLLVAVARRLSEVARDDEFVGRIGGDLFAVRAKGADRGLRTAEEAAQWMHSVLAAPFDIGRQQITLDATVGLTALDGRGGDPDEALRRSQLALHTARDSDDLSWAAYSPELRQAVETRIRITKGLRSALDKQRFELHFQPQVRLDTGGTTSAEALLRWRHPVDGLQSPAQFIPVAERSQLILPIGEWVIRSACRQLREWHDAGFTTLRIAVNLSVIQLAQPGIVDLVAQALEDAGLEPSRLTLEITESVFAHNSELILDRMHRLRERGVRLSLDDFGTGYSSLSYLHQYPFDEIKIDRSFVQQCADQVHSRSIVQMVARIGDSLASDVVAEGIETPEQARMMRDLGCGLGQGFYFARPVPGEAFFALLQSRQALSGKSDGAA